MNELFVTIFGLLSGFVLAQFLSEFITKMDIVFSYRHVRRSRVFGGAEFFCNYLYWSKLLNKETKFCIYTY